MISEPQIEAVCADLLVRIIREKGSASLRVTGWSMLPAIRPGDVLSVQRHSASKLRPGEVVLFRRNGRLTAHRFLGMEGERLITRGDCLPSCDLPVSRSELVGRVKSIRRNGKVVGMEQSSWQRLAALVLRRSVWCTKLFMRLNSAMQKRPVSQATFEC